MPGKGREVLHYFMEIIKKQINDTQVELNISLSAEDIKPHLTHTANHLSRHTTIPGFRPGKAPYEIVKKHIGEPVIFKEAMDDIVNVSLNEAIRKENLRVMDESDFKTQAMTPESINYSITLTLLPQVTLGNWQELKLEKKGVTVTDEEAEQAAADFAKLLVEDKTMNREAKMDDKAIIDFEVIVDGKIIEGGVGKSFAIVIGEKKMIPGFEEQIIGHKAQDEFNFKLKFPEDYAPNLSGKEAEFKIKVHSVMERIVPAIDDTLAKRVGETDKTTLINRLKENLQHEKEDKELQRLEVEAIKKIVDISTIGPIPAKALDIELDRVLGEFEHDLSHQGISIETYLTNAKKKLEDIRVDLKPKAEERLRTSLILSQLIDEHNIEVTEQEVETELNQQKEYYRSKPEALKDITDPNYRRHLHNRILNRKAVQFILDKLLKK